MLDWFRRLRGVAADEGPQRWVVVDVETSGFDPTKDGLISIGGVAMRSDGRVLPGEAIEIVCRQSTASSRENILVHGIGVQAQEQGVDPAEATRAFLDFVRASPIIAFHAPFDRGFLARAVKVFVNQPFDNPWLDLAELAPAVDPEAKLKSLDEWLARYSISVSVRHSAAADAFATGLLATRLLPRAWQQGVRDFASLQKMARQAKWLNA
ncbi:MAG: 3'-5' exonuclease [Burkholderiales bacterium]|jgi:DNA polymerase-3 subunit epsilon|nr:3'-5' exonuclease [Burkholderiales bacterium]